MRITGPTAGWRTNLAFWLPGFIAAAFILLQSKKPPVDRVMVAVAAAVSVEVVTAVGAAVCAVLAAKLLGQRDSLTATFSTQKAPLLASMLLGTVVWVAWQINRERTIVELAICAERAVNEDLLGPRQAVLDCWRNRSADDYDE